MKKKSNFWLPYVSKSIFWVRDKFRDIIQMSSSDFDLVSDQSWLFVTNFISLWVCHYNGTRSQNIDKPLPE